MVARTDKGDARQRFRLTRRGDRFGLLLLLLVSSYLLSAFTANDLTTISETALFVGTLLLALRTSRASRRAVRTIVSGAVAGSVVVLALALSHATSRDVAVGVANLWVGLILLITVGVILRRVLDMPTVSLQSIFAAVSAYMIIGLMFAWFYAAISHLAPAPFFADGSPGNTKTFQYFSFTTLTTLGYGDFTAAQNIGRAVAVMEALGGQIFLATLVARLVASYRAPRRNGSGHHVGTDNAAGSTAPGGAGPAGAAPAGAAPAGAGRDSSRTASPSTGPGSRGSRGTDPRRGGSGGSAGTDPGDTGQYRGNVRGARSGDTGLSGNHDGARPRGISRRHGTGTSTGRRGIRGAGSSHRARGGSGTIRGTRRIQGEGTNAGRTTRRQTPVKWRNRRRQRPGDARGSVKSVRDMSAEN